MDYEFKDPKYDIGLVLLYCLGLSPPGPVMDDSINPGFSPAQNLSEQLGLVLLAYWL